MEKFNRKEFIPWVVSELSELGHIDLESMHFLFQLKDEGPIENNLGVDVSLNGHPVVLPFFIAASLFLSPDRGDHFLKVQKDMLDLVEPLDEEKLYSENSSFLFSVDFSDPKNPILTLDNFTAKGLVVSYLHLLNEFGEEKSTQVSDFMLDITKRLISLQENILIVDDKEEAK